MLHDHFNLECLATPWSIGGGDPGAHSQTGPIRRPGPQREDSEWKDALRGRVWVAMTVFFNSNPRELQGVQIFVLAQHLLDSTNH